MRNEFKTIEITITYTKTNHNTEVEVKHKAELEYSLETTFASIERFLEDFKKVLNGYKHCMKNATYCQVYLSVATYDHAQSYESLHQTSFDGWKFEDVPSVDDEGLYLAPDVRYTNEQHDMFIAFAEPILSQLAQASI